MLDKIVYAKKNANKLVEDELDEFRTEIEEKFQNAQTRSYIMPRAKVVSKLFSRRVKNSSANSLDGGLEENLRQLGGLTESRLTLN